MNKRRKRREGHRENLKTQGQKTNIQKRRATNGKFPKPKGKGENFQKWRASGVISITQGHSTEFQKLEGRGEFLKLGVKKLKNKNPKTKGYKT